MKIPKTRGRLVRENAELEQQMRDMEAQLEVSQAQIEVMNMAVEREAQKTVDFIGRLVHTMGEGYGGEISDEAGTLAQLRVIRGRADKYVAIRDVLAGRFDPDDWLLKRLACALGTSQVDQKSVIERAGVLATANVRAAQMEVELRKAQDELADDGLDEWVD